VCVLCGLLGAAACGGCDSIPQQLTSLLDPAALVNFVTGGGPPGPDVPGATDQGEGGRGGGDTTSGGATDGGGTTGGGGSTDDGRPTDDADGGVEELIEPEQGPTGPVPRGRQWANE
jgi:hypothetical protein